MLDFSGIFCYDAYTAFNPKYAVRGAFPVKQYAKQCFHEVRHVGPPSR